MSTFNPIAKLFNHGDRIKEWLTTGRARPILAEISPTGYCNAKCDWCSFADKHEPRHVDADALMQALVDLSSLDLLGINWAGGGEPTIHPHFDRFVSLAHDLGIKQGLFTNAYRPIKNPEYFSWIRVSWTDKGLDKAIRPTVPFGVNLNQTPEQSPEFLTEACLRAREFGASYFQVRPALTGDWRTQPELSVPLHLLQYTTPEFEVNVTNYKYSDYRAPKHYPDCYGYHLVPAIDWNGLVSACPYQMGAPYVFGDINKESFLDVWKKLPLAVPADDTCWNCCHNHETNKALYDAKHIKNPEFI